MALTLVACVLKTKTHAILQPLGPCPIYAHPADVYGLYWWQWYPGHIARAERQLKASLKLVDVVIEVRDARIPLATTHPQVRALYHLKGSSSASLPFLLRRQPTVLSHRAEAAPQLMGGVCWVLKSNRFPSGSRAASM